MDDLALRHDPGTLPVWARRLVIAACAVSVLLAFVGPRIAFSAHQHSWYDRNLVGSLVLLAIVALWEFRRAPHSASLRDAARSGKAGPCDRYIQLAVALPIIHLLALGGMFVLWTVHPPTSTDGMSDNAPLMQLLTVPRVLVATVVFYAVAGFAISRREAVHAIVMVALLTTLLAGLWLPFASRVWWGHVYLYDFDGRDLNLGLLVLLPPALAAVLATALLFRVKHELLRIGFAWVFAVLLALCVLASMGMPDRAAIVYDNYLHVIVTLAGAAIGALVLLAASLGLRRRRARRALAKPALSGTVADDGVVARVEIASWLRGPRDVVAPFTIKTKHGDVHVPGGKLLASIPPETTQLRDGEGVPALSGGDEVVLTGFAVPDGDHPFRGSSAPLASGPIMIARTGDRADPLATIGYALWRPSLAYLFVLVTVGVPALLAAALY